MAFTFTELGLAELTFIEPDVFDDERGLFLEVFKKSQFAAAGITDEFVQINYSRSAANVLRGLHYQLPPAAQAKLITVLSGAILDVAVDIRPSSATYGEWIAKELSQESRAMLYVPVGFAHGFYVLSDSAEVAYYCGAEYAPESERGVLWNDPAIGIDWPTEAPLLSEKDAAYPLLADAENTFT